MLAASRPVWPRRRPQRPGLDSVRRNAAGIGARRHLHAGWRAALPRVERLPRGAACVAAADVIGACASTTRAWPGADRRAGGGNPADAARAARRRRARRSTAIRSAERPWLRVKCTPVFEPGGDVRRGVHPDRSASTASALPRVRWQRCGRRSSPWARWCSRWTGTATCSTRTRPP
ncbi:MAG: hypothetical protein MZV64_48590 [Ignavibacteriales bacterium]|nr:hypothetical protein [Ignavibacteriales bacterium]